MLDVIMDMDHSRRLLLSNGTDTGAMDNQVLSVIPILWASAAICKRARYEVSNGDIGPSWYMKPRSTIHWWNHFVFHTEADDERWQEMFRMPYTLFTSLVTLVGDDIRQQAIPQQLARIPGRVWSTEKKVAMAILLLASGNRQHHIANTFGCGRSIVSRFLYQFVRALVRNDSSKICWPSTEGKMQDIKEGFRAMRGLANCCGAIDCTHILMNLPKNEANEAWFDRNGDYSMIVQGVVDHRMWFMDLDHRMRFMDLNIGWPGSCNDKRVLRNSGLYRLCQGRERLAGPAIKHLGLSISEYIMGDGGYVLLPWMMIPFQRPMLVSAAHRRFNFL
ncbi:hypothetical protein L7F22_044771 [Adiantum nelumboides]|nr:hypothetical protein [Adiantum nelumboides]